MIALINTLQLIIHLPILNVYLPMNCQIFFKYLLPFAMFDVFDPILKQGIAIESVVDFPEDDAENYNFEI